jgi:hypothetical protein
MDRRKFAAVFVSLATAVTLLIGSTPAQAELTGYLMGDPAPGKVVPFYHAAGNLATIIGIESTFGNSGPGFKALRSDAFVAVHVTIFTVESVEITDFNLCLSPFDFGYVILQEPAASPAQLAEALAAFGKRRVLSVEADDIPRQGYVTLKTLGTLGPTEAVTTCGKFVSTFAPGDPEPLAVWTILQDVGAGFFATEIPTPTAIVDSTSGKVSGGFGAYGLIPGPFCGFRGNRVITRFDVNPSIGSETLIYVFLLRNAGDDVPLAGEEDGDCVDAGREDDIRAFLDCEGEFEQSTTLPLPDEVNIIDPNDLPGINQCKLLGQFRGVLRFDMPDTGFLWSHIGQADFNFRENFLGYNLECNWFIDFFCEIGD